MPIEHLKPADGPERVAEILARDGCVVVDRLTEHRPGDRFDRPALVAVEPREGVGEEILRRCRDRGCAIVRQRRGPQCTFRSRSGCACGFPPLVRSPTGRDVLRGLRPARE